MHVTAGQILAERYRIEEPLGRGGFALVYRATDLVEQRPVALKTHRADKPELRTALLEEFKQLRGRGLARIPAMLDQFEVKGQLFIVLEYLPGRTLDSWLSASDQPLPVRLALEWTSYLLETLAALHRVGLTHRDVKPQNIIIHAQSGLPYLIDFGLAKEQGTTRVHGFSPDFAAPEQLLPVQPTSPATDVYAVGMVLLAMLQGVGVPLPEAQADDSHRAGVEEQLRAKPYVGEALVQVVSRCLAYQPEERFPDAAAMLAALRPLCLPQPDVTVPLNSYGDPQQQIAMWYAEQSAAQEQHEQLRNQVQALQALLDQASAQAQAETQQRLPILQADLTAARQEMERLQGQRDHAVAQAQASDAAQQQASELQTRLATATRERDGLAARLNTTQQQLEAAPDAAEVAHLRTQRRQLSFVAGVCAVIALLAAIGMLSTLLTGTPAERIVQVTVEVTRMATVEVVVPSPTNVPVLGATFTPLPEASPTPEATPTLAPLLSNVAIINGTPSEGANSWPALFTGRLPITLQLNGTNLEGVEQISLVLPGSTPISATLSLVAVTSEQIVAEVIQLPQDFKAGTYELWLDEGATRRFLDLHDYLRIANANGVAPAHLYSADLYPPLTLQGRPRDPGETFTLLYARPDRTTYADWMASVRRNDRLEILDDRNAEWYRVRLLTSDQRNNFEGWVLRWVAGDGIPSRPEPQAIQIPSDLRGQSYQLVEMELQARGVPREAFVRDFQDRTRIGAVYDQFAANEVVSSDPPFDGWWTPGRPLILGIRAP
jgi:serine/threonine protein kinase